MDGPRTKIQKIRVRACKKNMFTKKSGGLVIFIREFHGKQFLTKMKKS